MNREDVPARIEQLVALGLEVAAGTATMTRLAALAIELGVDLVSPDDLKQYLTEAMARRAREVADVVERAKFGP